MPLEFLTFPPTSNQSPSGLVVCLHGWGANSDDLVSLAAVLDLPRCQFFFPNAPFGHPHVPGGRMWYDLEGGNYEGLTESQQQLRDWLNTLEEKTGVPLSRTVLSGFSQGGAMTLDVGLNLPLAGLVSLSGYLHREPKLNQAQSPPILMVHGTQDPIVPLSAAQTSRDALLALSVAVQYHELRMGHEILPDVLKLMREFILMVMD